MYSGKAPSPAPDCTARLIAYTLFTVRAGRRSPGPRTFWEEVQSSEYGFWANVNPNVPHPRWSQASERVLGQDQRLENLRESLI